MNDRLEQTEFGELEHAPRAVFLTCSCAVSHQLEPGTTTSCSNCGDLLDADSWELEDAPLCLGCGEEGHTLEDHAANPDL